VEFTSHYWLLEAVNPDVNGETDLQRLVYPGMEAVGIQKVRRADETCVRLADRLCLSYQPSPFDWRHLEGAESARTFYTVSDATFSTSD
jgi:hypothetical protein